VCVCVCPWWGESETFTTVQKFENFNLNKMNTLISNNGQKK